jgi:hypothetical protein
MPKIEPTIAWCEAIIKHIDKLETNQERYEFAQSIIFDIAMATSSNSYEAVGILEHVKMDLFASVRDFNDNKGSPEDCKDCPERDNCPDKK